jgi:hypothetical protein
MTPAHSPRLTIDVVELNPHAPRPFVFTEAALCLRDSIRAAGFASERHVNQGNPDALTLLLGAVPPHLALLDQLDPRKTAIVNLEQLASGSALITPDYVQWLRKWLVVDYHSENIAWLRRANGEAQQVFQLPLVPGSSLVHPAPDPGAKSVDVLFFGSPSPRREHIIQRLRDAGVSVETVAGAYAHELAPALRRARLVLNVHFYETGLFPVTRILQPAANGIPIVCETSVFSEGADWSASGILFAGYGAIVEACITLLRSGPDMRERALQTRRFAAHIDFATPFRALVKAMALRMVQVPVAAVPSAPRAVRPARPPQPASLLPPLPVSPPVPVRRPVAVREQATTRGADPDESPADTAEIEAILAREATRLPLEAHLQPPPLKLAEREPGKGRYGLWIVALLLVFSLYTIWQSMPR